MKKILSISLFVLIGMAVATAVPPKAKLDVQYVAVHFGDASLNDILTPEDFPAFQFYTSTSDVYTYYERVKAFKKPEFLKGWYGEFPEKMGMGPNYVQEKIKMNPFPNGAIYVIDSEGTVFYQINNNEAHYNANSNSPDLHDRLYAEVKKAVKSTRKGKLAKKVKAENYLKKSPVGELEYTKKSKIDKKQVGIEGFQTPDLMLNDANGNLVSLRDVCKEKVTVLVVYSMNAYNRKVVQEDGTIKEIAAVKLINPKAYAENAVKKAENADNAMKGMMSLGKSALNANKKASYEDYKAGKMTDKAKMELYRKNTKFLDFIQDFSKSVK